MAKKVEYKIISAKEFLKAKPSGQFNHEESIKALIEIASLVDSAANQDVLLDFREAYAYVTLFDLHNFITELSKHRSVFSKKIAVLSRNDQQFDNVKFMELCAENRGFQVAGFTSFEESIDWLSMEVEAKKL